MRGRVANSVKKWVKFATNLLHFAWVDPTVINRLVPTMVVLIRCTLGNRYIHAQIVPSVILYQSERVVSDRKLSGRVGFAGTGTGDCRDALFA